MTNRKTSFVFVLLVVIAICTLSACSNPTPTAPAVTVTLSASSTTAIFNGSVELLWFSSMGVMDKTCSIPGLFTNESPTGRISTPSLTSAQTYQMTCKTTDGSLVMSNPVVVEVLPPSAQNSLTMVSCDPPAPAVIPPAGKVTCIVQYVALQKGRVGMGFLDSRGWPNGVATGTGHGVFVDPGAGQVEVWANSGSNVVQTSKLRFDLTYFSGEILQTLTALEVDASYTHQH